MWNIFGTMHLLSLPFAALIIIALYFILKKRSKKVQTVTLFVLSLSGISAIIFNLVKWNSPLEYLPLHLCSIDAILLPIAILTKNKTICNMLSVWCIGALAAISTNFFASSFADLFCNPVHLFFYIPHVLEFGIPILLFKLKIVKLEIKYIPVTLALTGAIYTAVHFINVSLISFAAEHNLVDYAGNPLHINNKYSLDPEGLPIQQQIFNIFPNKFWYMFFVFPIIAAYLLMLFIPGIIKHRRKK